MWIMFWVNFDFKINTFEWNVYLSMHQTENDCILEPYMLCSLDGSFIGSVLLKWLCNFIDCQRTALEENAILQDGYFDKSDFSFKVLKNVRVKNTNKNRTGGWFHKGFVQQLIC